MQYANSLIGRQLKTLWKAVGQLTALLWFPEIADLQQYLADIDVAVANVLDTFAEIDPTKIIQKIKLHLLTHLHKDILRFGPLVGMCTEGYECYNAVFRMCSVLSNHLAPSRDIALQLADQEALKHRLTGGWWPSADHDWTRAGSRVRDFLYSHSVLQRILGWTPEEQLIPGSFKLQPLKPGMHTHDPMRLDQTAAVHALNYSSFDPALPCIKCRYCIAASEDKCLVGAWVFSKSPLDNAMVASRIINILAHDSQVAYVVIDIFEVASTRHARYDMPYLVHHHDEASSMIVCTKDIKFTFNVQHDCMFAQYMGSGRRAHRRTKHFEIAKMLRDSQETKRAARKAANDAKKATAVSIVEEGLDEFSSRKRRREDAPE
ncbi:hypothetical protein A0H81_13364 [Grifola frondosa]|uniref:Uncharacterized protein n=1 Tax=Grifola frondosa TaxID=5627 RepID=A0A1C7LPP9_GRIFR|nr:hypothetical protein A0H81_13364 [Grifola frondosa]